MEKTVKKGSYVSKRKPRDSKEEKKEREKARLEKLKLAEYCPKISGCSWDHAKKRD